MRRRWFLLALILTASGCGGAGPRGEGADEYVGYARSAPDLGGVTGDKGELVEFHWIGNRRTGQVFAWGGLHHPTRPLDCLNLAFFVKITPGQELDMQAKKFPEPTPENPTVTPIGAGCYLFTHERGRPLEVLRYVDFQFELVRRAQVRITPKVFARENGNLFLVDLARDAVPEQIKAEVPEALLALGPSPVLEKEQRELVHREWDRLLEAHPEIRRFLGPDPEAP